MMDRNPPLTPEEAAQILKISKYTLYELIKRGEIQARRIGRQLRIDPEVLTQFTQGGVAAKKPVPESTVLLHKGVRFVGSHDPIVELLIEFWRHSAATEEIEPMFAGSMEGLFALYKKEADLAGVHLWDEKAAEYNIPFLPYVLPGEDTLVINLVQRIQGWIVAPGNPFQIEKFEDIGKKGLRFINRQKGSGTRLQIDAFLRKASITPRDVEGYENEETTHYGVAYRVASGEADAGIGVQAAAQRMGLDFVPLFKERYDLVTRQEVTQAAWWKQMVEILRAPAFSHAIHSQVGYDTSLTGKILTEK